MSQLRLLARLALVACLCVSTQSLLVVQGAFHLNREAIAEALCVNKARPEMDCDGHCELMKRLHSHREHERDEGAAMLDVALAIAAMEREADDVPTPPARSARLGGVPEAGVPTGDSSGVWRPPRARV